jgi:hypothetical protein
MSILAASIDPQTTAAGLIVLVAVGYLARRVWLSVRSKRLGGCGTCATCPVDSKGNDSSGNLASGNQQSVDGRPLVTLESLAGSARRENLKQTQAH